MCATVSQARLADGTICVEARPRRSRHSLHVEATVVQGSGDRQAPTQAPARGPSEACEPELEATPDEASAPGPSEACKPKLEEELVVPAVLPSDCKAPWNAGPDDDHEAIFQAFIEGLRQKREEEKRRLEALATEPETVAEAQRWPAHRAAYDDDVERLRQLSVGWQPADWAQLDCCGNSVAHVAALRGSLGCLRLALECGYPPETKNSAGWTAVEESIDRRDRVGARLVWDLTAERRREAEAHVARAREASLETLRQMPDLSMRFRWHCGSPLFGLLLKRHAPSDTYRVWKRGDRLRIDGTLLGLSGSDEERKKGGTWRRGRFSVLVAPAEGGGGLKVCLASHSSRRYCWPDQREPSPVPGKATLSLAVGADGGVRCAVGTAPVLTEEDISFGQFFSTQLAPRPSFERVDPKLRPVLDWLGRPAAEKAGDHMADVWEASSRLRWVEVQKANRYELRASFEAYVHSRELESNSLSAEMVQLPTSSADMLRTVGVRTKSDEGSTLRAKLWLTRQFPLRLEHLLLLLRVVSVANARIKRLVAALEQWELKASFPIKMQVPLFMTLYLQLLCSDYAPLGAAEPEPGWFDLPGAEPAAWAEYREVSLNEMLGGDAAADVGGPRLESQGSTTETLHDAFV